MVSSFVLTVAALSGCVDGASDTAKVAPTSVDVEFWPPEAGRGTTFDADITATSSIFESTGNTLDLGTGVTVNSVTMLDGWHETANLTIAAGAPLGARDATLGTATSGDFSIASALTVVDESFTLAPSRGKIGESVEVEFVGQNTAWTSGATWAEFGDGIDVQDVTVYSDTYLVATINIAPDAIPGLRDVIVEDGSDVVTAYNAFEVDRVGIGATWDPASMKQGETVSFTVHGVGTHFDNSSAVTFFSGGYENGDVVVDSLTVLDAQNLYGEMTASNAAEIGYRDVRIETDGEGVYLPDAFQVEAGDIDLSDVGISLAFNVYRGIDNTSGAISESVEGYAIFYLPLDPPCPSDPESSCSDGVDNDSDSYTDCYDSDCSSDPACAGGPMPYDVNGNWVTYSTGGSEDCPTNVTVGAGEHVWFESDCNVVTFDRYVDSSSGMIYYTAPLTLDDYCFNQVYDLHTEGEDGGIGEYVLEDVQPTVPADFELLDPEWWGNYTASRAEDLTYTWSPAQTYPNAIFGTSISGTLAATGDSGYIGALPWDDGEHTYTSADLSALEPGTCTFSAYSYIKGNYFGFPFSTIQTNQSDSVLYIQGTVVLE